MPPNRFESEVESFLEGSHGDRTHIKRADHHTVTPLCGTLLGCQPLVATPLEKSRRAGMTRKAGDSCRLLSHSCPRVWRILVARVPYLLGP